LTDDGHFAFLLFGRADTGVETMSAQETNSETMTLFSPQLAARFDALVQRYPVKRSALVPMLLYAQDEVGYLSDAVIAEVAERIGITELDVRSVASYYSMLRFKPVGRYNIQVCTNISCMLRGAYELYERFQDELGIGPGGTTPDGLFSLEEVECIGDCCSAPAIQVNYDFLDELKPELVASILDSYRSRARAEGEAHDA
jgi:NADH-quinone oxidoreductase subunit E